MTTRRTTLPHRALKTLGRSILVPRTHSTGCRTAHKPPAGLPATPRCCPARSPPLLAECFADFLQPGRAAASPALLGAYPAVGCSKQHPIRKSSADSGPSATAPGGTRSALLRSDPKVGRRL